MTTKPKFIQEFEKTAKKFEGSYFPNTIPYYSKELNMELSMKINPSSFAESFAQGILYKTRDSVKLVESEPNGNRSFPDLKAIFSNGYNETVEVKSWYSAQRGWAAASVNKYEQAIANRDPKYLVTWYIDFDLVDMGDLGYLVQNVTVGRIWDFSTGEKTTGTVKSYRSDRSSNAEDFIFATIPDEKDRIWARSVVNS